MLAISKFRHNNNNNNSRFPFSSLHFPFPFFVAIPFLLSDMPLKSRGSSSLSFEKHLKSMLSSSSSNFFHPHPKTVTSLSFQTLASAPRIFSSSAASCRLSVLSSLVCRSQPHRRPRLLFSSLHPAPRAFSSASSGQELEWREDHHLHHHQPPQEHHSVSPAALPCSDDEDDGGYQDHLLELQQEKRTRFIPVKAYFLCTRSSAPSFSLFLSR